MHATIATIYAGRSRGDELPGSPGPHLTSHRRRGKGLEGERRALRMRFAQERGFTLIEVLLASAAAVVVFTATLAVLQSSQQVEARDAEWALTLQEGRAGVARMVREMRQAYSIKAATGSSIDFLVTLGGNDLEISYQCNSTGAPIVRDVLNETAADSSDPVFSYSPNATAPTFATVKVALPSAGTLKQAGSTGYKHQVVLSSGAYIRNVSGA